jgi:DNA (cytosine-5)-methyltransferase 1
MNLLPNRYVMMDFFSGAGGLSWGMKEAGFTSVFAFDSDSYACESYRRNIGQHIYEVDALTLTSQFIIDKTGLNPGEITLICGGPPCQGFSVQRRGLLTDARNDLVVSFAKIATEFAPTFILMENVPGLVGKRGREHLQLVTQIFRHSGYEYASAVLDAANYGVAQHRKRAFVLAWRPDVIKTVAFPKATHNEGTWKTVREAIGDLPEPPEDYTEHPDFANHTRVHISPLNEQRIAHVPPGGGRLDIPLHLQLPCHRNDNGHRHLDVYGRLSWNKPSGTVTAMFDNFTRGRFAHPDQHRSITAREGARLQSFPDAFRFYGPKKDVARQIGNAVPPLLAQVLGEAIVAALEQRSVDITEANQLGLPLELAVR